MSSERKKASGMFSRGGVRVAWFASVLTVLAAVACSSPDDGENQPISAGTAYVGARVITGDDGPAIEDAVFLVEDGRFTGIGPRGEIEVPGGSTVIDLAGTTVMPAVVNTHMHLSSTREELVEELRHNAYYGAAAVVSLGTDPGGDSFQVREEVIPGAARYLTAGRGITRPEPGRSEVPYWIDSADEGREAIRELAAVEVDLVKIWVDDRNGQYEKLTPELYRAVIDEAHAHDLRVTAHIFHLADAKGLLEAGVDAFAHGVRDQDVDREFLSLITERPEFYYVPNLPDPGVARDLGWLSGTIPADQLQEMQAAATDRPEAQEAYGIQARNLARVEEAGVRIGFGTDGGSPFAVHLEMEDMVRAGMTPAEVIVAVTRTSAELLRLEDLGTIESGKSADFLVLEANPLDDITNTRRIRSVYLRGAELDRDALGAQLRRETAEGSGSSASLPSQLSPPERSAAR